MHWVNQTHGILGQGNKSVKAQADSIVRSTRFLVSAAYASGYIYLMAK